MTFFPAWYNNITIDKIITVITIDKIITAIIILVGFWLLAKYFWMVIYQLKYGKDYGERYIKGEISKEEKQELKRDFKWRRFLKK